MKRDSGRSGNKHAKGIRSAMERRWRHRLVILLLSVLIGGAAQAQGEPFRERPTLAVMDFELVDNHPDPAEAEVMAQRLARTQAVFSEAIVAAGLYQLADMAPARALHERQRAQQLHLHRCASCQLEVAKLAGAQWVASGWVFKVSKLILYVNVSLREVASGEERVMKSVSIRGDNDRSWERGIRYIVRQLAEDAAPAPDPAS